MEKIVTEKLNIISKKNGSIFPIIKSDSEHFSKFGEVYISSIGENVVRAWKKHKSLKQYFVVPIGKVKFVFLINNKFEEIIIGSDNYSFIKVPKNIWYGFKNLSSKDSYIINFIDLPHSKGNSEFSDYNENKIKGYNWSK